MVKLTAVYRRNQNDKVGKQQKSKSGLLLIDQQDEIIYANQQARQFLGLFSDEAPPFKQKFMTLVQSAYRCYPAVAWLSWPKLPSIGTTRHLIYTPPNSSTCFRLKVEIMEQIIIDGTPVWAVAMIAEELGETAVSPAFVC